MWDYRWAWRNRASPIVPDHDPAFEKIAWTVDIRLTFIKNELEKFEPLTRCIEEPRREDPEWTLRPPVMPARFHMSCGSAVVDFEPYRVRVTSGQRVRLDRSFPVWGLNPARYRGFPNVDDPTFYLDERRGVLVVRLHHLGTTVSESEGEGWHAVKLEAP
jgi:hypothetical protein